ncbi:MAG: hypothetical protein K0R61_3581 [Microvirga sp.]|jgi:hypothetical protein|nr:hypothetical protein [Microvirga sp.]
MDSAPPHAPNTKPFSAARGCVSVEAPPLPVEDG